MPKAANEPVSPTSPGYSSSDHASAGSGYFSRTTSSDTSHSSQPSVGNLGGNPATDQSPPGDNASTRTAEPVTPGPAKVPSIDGGSRPPAANVGTSSSGPPIPISSQRPETALDRLEEPVPGFIKALREDVALEVARLGTDVQTDIGRVEGKVDGIQRTLNEHISDIKRIQGADEGKAETTVSGVGDTKQVDDGHLGTANGDVLGAVEQYLEKSTNMISEQLEKSAKATQDRLAKFETEMSGKFTKFTEEMAGKYTQLEQDIANQIRVELGSEKQKYDSTLALQAYISEMVEDELATEVVAEASPTARVERLSGLVDQLKVNVASAPTSSAAPTSPAALPVMATSDPAGAPGPGPRSGRVPPSSLAPTVPSRVQLLVQEIIRITATFIPPMRRGRLGRNE